MFKLPVDDRRMRRTVRSNLNIGGVSKRGLVRR